MAVIVTLKMWGRSTRRAK